MSEQEPAFKAEQFALPLPAEEPAHHPYGMSVLNYLYSCEAFKGRGGENEAALDGTRLHGINEKTVEHYLSSEKVLHVEPSSSHAQTHSALASLRHILETEPVSEEEEFYLEFCARELDQWLPRATRVLTEQRVYIYNPGGSVLNYGHYDALLFLGEEVAIVFDWKFGWLPVPPAQTNWQGKGYATGVFQRYPKLKKVGVVFVQPKLHKITRTTYDRSEVVDMWQGIHDVIERAKSPNHRPTPGPYCDFCAHAATCSGLLNEANRAVAVYEGLPVPTGFTGLQINNAEDAAKAMFVLDRLKVLLDRADELKEKAKKFARDNGGLIGTTLPNGKMITVELRSKQAARSANNPGLIAEVLKDYLSPEQILAACDPKVTALEEIFADAFVSRQAAEAQAVVDQGEAEARRLESSGDHTGAAQARDKAKREAKAIRITRKKAVEILNSMLLAEGLITRPEGRIEYLKVRIETPVKQATQIQHVS